MKNTNKTLFNLIEIFRQGKQSVKKTLHAATYCKESSVHDYYCDAERPI